LKRALLDPRRVTFDGEMFMIIQNNWRKPLLFLAVTGVLMTVAATTLRRASGDSASLPTSVSLQPSSPTSEPTPLPRQMVLVFIHNEDLYPSVVSVKAGEIFLRIENWTQKDVSLVVERVISGEGEQRVKDVQTSNKAERAHTDLSLSPGEYVFYEQSRPDVKGKIIVK
jgi:cupredoxin-like protein